MTTAKERIVEDDAPVTLLVRPVADGEEDDRDHDDPDDDAE